MKKKRSGKKKSNTQNNKPNNSGTTAEVTIAPDKHHNWSRPCSALAASISKEIFPSIPSSNNDTDDLSTGKLLLTQQPLFAFIILRHMIEERKKIRVEQGVVDNMDEHNTHETEPITINTELDTLLDSYIDSKEALQILDSETKRWGERDIESFVTHLTQKFDCHAKKMQRKKSDKQCALQKDVLPTISIKDVSAHINSTNCRKCGTASAIQFRNMTSGLEIHLDPAIKENVSLILCNEGLVSPGSISKAGNTFRLELRPISSDTDRYLQIGAVLNDKDDGSELNYPINTQDIINLTKFIVLPKRITNADLGKEGLAKLSMQVKKEMKDIEETLRSVEVKLLGIKDSLEPIDPRLSFDSKTTKVLIGFDEQIDLGFQQLGYLLLQIFKLTSFVGWSAKRGFKFLQFNFALLERYNHALDSLIDPVQQYRGQIIRAADSDGRVPQPHKNRAARDGLQKLIEIKMNVLGKLSQDIERAVKLGFQYGETSCVVQILVLQQYRQSMDTSSKERCSPDKVFPDKTCEALMTRVIAARINLAAVNIRGLSISGLEDKSREHCEEVTSLCKNIRKIVVAMEDSAPETKVGFLEMCYEKHESIYYEIEKQQKAGLYNDRGKEACDTAMLLRKSNHLMKQLLIVLCSLQCNGSSQDYVTLPRDADKWLDSIVNSDIPNPNGRIVDSKASNPGDNDDKCEGGSGQRRVSSVFSGLVYRWLEEQCSEWHAESTKDELLQSLGIDEPADDSSTKSGNKKKSRRKGQNGEENVSIRNDGDITPTNDNNEKVNSSSPTKTVAPSIVPNSSSGDMAEEKKYEEADFQDGTDPVDQSQPTHNENDDEDRIDNLDQNVDTPTEDSSCTDEYDSAVESSPTSPDNLMYEQVDTREDTLSYLASIRSRLKEEIIGNIDMSVTGDSINQNVRAIQALLISNEEIYNRCRGHIESGTDEKTTFTKANYTVINAHHDEVTSMFQFVTYPEHCRLEFDTAALSNLPFSLNFGIITFSLEYKSGGSCFIDYTALFESLIMLHPDIQGPFLDKLKDHLKTVHNCLSKIDDWLSAPSSNVKYLQESFGGDKLQVSNKTIKHFCIEGSHQDDEVCFQCEGRFDQHTVEQRQVNSNSIEGKHRRLCPHPEDKDLPYFLCSKCDADSESQCPHYQVEELYVLRELGCSGTFDTTFNISEVKGRAQLEKFLGFIESIAE